jgi:hypothetical protein
VRRHHHLDTEARQQSSWPLSSPFAFGSGQPGTSSSWIIMKVPCLVCRRHLPLSCCFHLRIELLARLFFPELSQLCISMVSISFSTIDCCCMSYVRSCMSIRKLVTLNSFTKLFYCLSGLMTSCLPHSLSNNDSVYLKLHSRMHHQPAT